MGELCCKFAYFFFLKKIMLYEPSIDLVNSNVYTKFGLMLFIISQDIEQKPYSDIDKGGYSVANLQKQTLTIPANI